MYSANQYRSGMAADTTKAPRLDEPDERLRWARERAGFKKATDAARRFGWNENTYRSHDNGTRDISRKAAARYARAYKVPIGWLLTGEGSMSEWIDPELVNLWDQIKPEDRPQALRLLRAFAIAA